MTLPSRSVLYGIIYGQALGDALGYYTEFKYENALRSRFPTPESYTFPPHEGAAPMRKNRESDCDWTDDTDHLILLMDMLTESGNQLNPQLFADKLKTWVFTGFKELGDTRGEGCGMLTGNIVENSNFLTNPFMAAKDAWQGKNAPNGSIMRTAIMACRGKKYKQTIKDAVEMSLTTHYDPRCSVSVAVVVSILWFLINGETDTEKILNYSYGLCEIYGGSYVKECQLWFNKESLDDMDLNNQIGYTLKCMAVSVWTFKNRYSGSYKDIILKIILKGGDADTNASPAGAILGATYGFENLPQEWVSKLPNKSWLDDRIEKFAKIIEICRN
jgi:ADP-ribosylglycohydrolase